MAATNPHVEADSQKGNWRAAAAIADRVTPRKSSYDRLPDDRRIMLIGSALKAAGDVWAAQHARQMDWLRRTGITPAEAVAAYDAWESERLADPVWQEMSERCRPSQAGA